MPLYEVVVKRTYRVQANTEREAIQAIHDHPQYYAYTETAYAGEISPPGSYTYRDARGVLPREPGDPLPEDVIREVRGQRARQALEEQG